MASGGHSGSTCLDSILRNPSVLGKMLMLIVGNVRRGVFASLNLSLSDCRFLSYSELRTKAITQEKVVSIAEKALDKTEMLMTTDAESSKRTSWMNLFTSTLNIYKKLPSSRKTAIIKLIIPDSETGVARELVVLEFATLASTHRWMKPVTSNARNNEIFLVVSDWLGLVHNSLDSARLSCLSASSILNMGEFIRIGLRLKSVAKCLNISRQNLKELSLLEPTTISPAKLLKRIRSMLSASWEELEVDTQYTDQVRKYGRDQALLRMVSLLIARFHIWTVGRLGVVMIFIRLSSVKFVIVRQNDSHRAPLLWPYTTSFGIRVDQASEDDSVVSQMKKALQKVLRASLELLEKRRPTRRLGHPDLEV